MGDRGSGPPPPGKSQGAIGFLEIKYVRTAWVPLLLEGVRPTLKCVDD